MTTGTVTYVDITCGDCGVTWGMPGAMYTQQLKWRERGGWYCPNGHRRFFVGKSDEQKLRDELARERHRLDQTRSALESTTRSLTATKGVVTRIKNRVSKGVCPCCSRTFADLARHMESKHPTWNTP